VIRRAACLLVAASCAGCSASAPGPPPAPPAASRAPYDAPPAGRHSIEIRVDSRAARDILAALSRPRYESSDAKLLRDLPAVRLAVQDSGRSLETFERDLAAAFDEETGSVVFDFRSIRGARTRWDTFLAALSSREAELARMGAERSAALLPSDRPVAVRMRVLLSFGLAGLADHLVVMAPEGNELMIVDLSRALGESESETVENQMSRVARLVAGETYRQAWAAYRSTSPNWMRPDPALGQVEPLLRVVAEAGPVALFHVDENFFPLSVWLKDAMKRSLAQLNRTAERLVESEADLERRVELVTEIRRPEFAQRLAGPAGAFLCDGIIQISGLEAFRSALAAGPRAFFTAYEEAQQRSRDLVPLSAAIRDRLGAAGGS